MAAVDGHDLAGRRGSPLRKLEGCDSQMICIDAVWLVTAPLDKQAGTDTALARVVKVFVAAHPDTAYLFANKRAKRMKVLMHDALSSGWLRNSA